MIGSFPKPNFTTFVLSPLCLTEKKEPGKYRAIQSFPFEGLALNSCIPQEAGTESYHTMDTAINLIQDIGQGCILYKTDIEHAYKLLRLHDDDIPALVSKGSNIGCGILPMGSWSGCSNFE